MPRVKVLVVGSGGREHALAWALGTKAGAAELHAAPGNPGLARLATCHPVGATEVEGLLALCHELAVELVVVGPEAPLVGGLADELRRSGISVFGPTSAAARIEGSKAFGKEVMAAARVPTAELLPGPRAPCVVKTDGLAAGKGVFVCRTDGELQAALTDARRFRGSLLFEELLEGEEASVFALCDGRATVALPAARDFKRLSEADVGPNTGGMGSFSPVPELSPSSVEELVEQVHKPVLAELARRGSPFVGLLYAGLMLTEGGPRVLEFNCRFGDPEAQSVLPLLDGDLLGALASAAAGDLGQIELPAVNEAAVTVVLAARAYPEAGDTGTPIEGLAAAESTGALVFHAGTALGAEGVVTNGGRILNVTGTGPSLAEARDRAYAATGRISFEGMRFRRDIALEAAAGARVA